MSTSSGDFEFDRYMVLPEAPIFNRMDIWKKGSSYKIAVAYGSVTFHVYSYVPGSNPVLEKEQEIGAGYGGTPTLAINDDRIVVGNTEATTFVPFWGLSHGRALVGGPGPDWPGVADITPPNPRTYDRYGWDVDIGPRLADDNQFAIIGHQAYSTPAAQKPVLVLAKGTNSTDNWVISQTLTDPVYTTNNFGNAVAMSEDYCIVGAPFVTGGVSGRMGVAHIFKRGVSALNAFTVIKTLSDIEDTTRMGAAVAMTDNFAAVGAPDDYEFVGSETWDAGGAVYLYGKDTGGSDNWGLIKKFTGSKTALRDGFGSKVAIHGNYLVVATDRISNSDANPGAYLYARHEGGTNNWGEVRTFVQTEGYRFGQEVAIDDGVILIGAPTVQARGSGRIYIYST